MRKQLTLSLCLCLIGGTASANTARLQAGKVAKALDNRAAVVAPDMVQAQAAVKIPVAHQTDEWLGESVVVGTTRYDYQHNGSTSKMLAVSSDGVVHGSFMGGIDAGANRRVQAYCVSSDLTLTPATDAIAQRTGYTTSATYGEDAQSPNSGVIGMHTGTNSWIGTDFAGCTLAFNLTSHSTEDILWPHVAVDGQNVIHMVSYGTSDSSVPNTVFYDASTDGTSWVNGDYLVLTDDSEGLGAIPVANNHSDRAAVVFFDKTGPEDMPYDGPPEGGEIGIQIHHDIMAYVSNTGDVSAEIIAGNPQNITSYGPGSDAPFGEYGCRAYCDVDGLFDMTNDENLHIVFSTDIMFSDSLHVYDGDGDYSGLEYYNWNLGKGQIWHVNADTGEWSHVAGYNSGITSAEMEFSRPQAWRMNQDRPQIAVDADTGYLYVIWSQYDNADMSDTDNNDPYNNGEIYARCSADNGATWGPAVNITNTQTPDCQAGDCDAEDWPSMAAVTEGGFLHISFVHDLDAGGIPFDPPEGEETLNNMVYLRLPVDEIPPHSGTAWDADGHVGMVTDSRWFSWTCDSWTGETAFLDSTHWIEPIHIFNESPFDVDVDAISFYKHPSDLLGAPEDMGLLELDLDVWSNDAWTPISQWSGSLSQWSGTKFRAHVAYSGLPNFDQLVVFHFDDREDLVYRVSYEASDDAECTGVGMLDASMLNDYDEVSLFTVGVEEGVIPGQFMLNQNYPNPFNPTTEIAFNLGTAGETNLVVFNMLGERVATLVDGRMEAGFHTVTFDASSLSSGLYFYSLESQGHVESRKMILLK